MHPYLGDKLDLHTLGTKSKLHSPSAAVPNVYPFQRPFCHEASVSSALVFLPMYGRAHPHSLEDATSSAAPGVPQTAQAGGPVLGKSGELRAGERLLMSALSTTSNPPPLPTSRGNFNLRGGE